MIAKEPMYEFTVVETGETWVGPMPAGSPAPDAVVTIGFPATEQLVVHHAPYTTDTVQEAVQIAKDLNSDLVVLKKHRVTKITTPEQLLSLKIDGNLTLHDLLSLAQCEGQLTTKDYGDDGSFTGIAQVIIDAVRMGDC